MIGQLRRATGMVAAVLVGTAVLAGCGLDTADNYVVRPAGVKESGASVDVTLRDFKIDASQASIPGGVVSFNVTDNGPTEHEFLIFASEADPANLPIKDGRVDEEDENSVKVFDSGDNIALQTTKAFTTALTPGHYVLICNLPGHYNNGMHTAFTVAEPATTPPVVQATVKDFSITVPDHTITPGLVDFAVTDVGPTAHEFVIFASDAAPGDLPLKDGRVDEDALTRVLDSGDNIDVGTTKTFHGALPPGNYVIVCNLPTHYLAGMHTSFTVTGPNGESPPTFPAA
jgi:uncharacterized cupredoxin-like copper-binding protein